ncbi:23S rRNA (adenine(1618)-N(6))-methyltransferase RlmF [Cecembia sp.]|uniref:23S rRNA (adenine(1618)-N(6))-methyltransferase RlmF n=1 Tax=Cecembia sp. TaxID=1898110 RepID=UPI0025C6D218|nr:23S rRNA (adenine(1618)-N(6))-methyltransferase RlmF [Cecembia sp.]
MPKGKKAQNPYKSVLHLRNKHRERYDFDLLIRALPDLKAFVITNKFGDTSIDFFDPKAVLALNRALLKQYYRIDYWSIPENYLCPPIPGRADYIHYVADLLAEQPDHFQNPVKCLDIGVGANCIYPIIGHQEYGWTFVGTDIDLNAIAAANTLISKNPQLKGHITLRYQSNSKNFFAGIIQRDEIFDLSICNPPFHASAKEAHESARRKLCNLKGEKVEKTVLNFGGRRNELWYPGGELKFLSNMIYESGKFSKQCRWFTSLVSKKENLDKLYNTLDAVDAKSIKTLEMGQGNKISRILAWSFIR